MTASPADGTADGVRGGLPLERKLPLLVLGLFTLVLFATLVVSYYQVRTAAIETSSDRLTALGKVFASLIEQQTTTRLALMRRISRDTAVQDALRARTPVLSPAAARALAPLHATPADSATPPLLWDSQGRPLGEPRLDLPADRRRVRDEVVPAIARGDSSHVTPLRVSNGAASVFEAVPVRDAAGALLGFIVQERRLNVNPRALPLLRGLIGADIDFYFRNAGDNTWVEASGASAPPPVARGGTTDSVDFYDHGSDGAVLASTSPIRGTPMLLTVERPMTAILARPLATMRVLIAISIILSVTGALAVWLLSRRLVRPLGELTVAAEEMARGQYDQRVEPSRRDEIGRLATAFNRMAAEVEASSQTSARALNRLTRSVEMQEFLAEASRILAGSVSDETLLTDLVRCCVPRLADYCSIHVASDDGVIRRIETAHRDPAMLGTVRALLAPYEYSIDSPGDVPAVMRTQQPIVNNDIDLAAAVRNAPDAETARLMETVAPNAVMVVPLVARGTAIGAMSFVMTGSTRTFAPDDLELAMELARRTAVAIDNAVIYRRSLQLRLEAEAASNAKSDFLAKMSHEIRTPINAMMGYAELLQMGISGPVNEAQAKQLARIRASGDHLTSLVGEILDLAKIEAGRMVVQPTAAPIGEAVENALTIVRPIATTKGVELSMAPDSEPKAEFFGDPQRVQQILANLLSNAVKFTPPGGSIVVRCGTGAKPGSHGRADWVCVSVIDSGVGIGADDLERIFHPFVQVDSGYTRTQGGTGLGLTISRNLAQLMGGDITVQSAPAQGSTFTLWLPCPIRAFAPV